MGEKFEGENNLFWKKLTFLVKYRYNRESEKTLFS